MCVSVCGGRGVGGKVGGLCVCVLKKRRKRERVTDRETDRQTDRQKQRQRETETKSETERKIQKSGAGERNKDSDRDLGEAKLPTAFNLTKQKNRENNQQKNDLIQSMCFLYP